MKISQVCCSEKLKIGILIGLGVFVAASTMWVAARKLAEKDTNDILDAGRFNLDENEESDD